MLDRVTIITVTHNSGLVISGLLESLPNYIRLIVVDNASTDNTLAIIATKRSDASVIRNSIGLGYGHAASKGFAAAETEFILLANPDSLVGEEAISALVEAADQFPDAAMLGPQHKTADGEIVLSHDVNLWKRRIYGKRSTESTPSGPICVEFISGAVTLVRTSVLQTTGFYDPEIFLYFEDDDICLRLRRAGFSLVLVPNSVVIHLNGGSVRPSRSYYWEKFWHLAWSRVYIEGKYRGTTAKTLLAAQLAIRFAFKALINGMTGRRQNCWRDTARFTGTCAALLGVKVARSDPSRNVVAP